MDPTLIEEEGKESSIMSRFRRTLVRIHDALELKGGAKPEEVEVSEINGVLDKVEETSKVLRDINLRQDKRLAEQGLRALQSDMIRQNELLTNIEKLIIQARKQVTPLIIGRIIDRIDEYIAISDSILSRSQKIKKAA